MSAEPVPMIHAKLDVALPASVVLPVQMDDDGKLQLATGFIMQRYLDHRDLRAMGITVSWQLADGEPIADDVALSLIEKASEQAQIRAANDEAAQATHQ